MSKSSVPQNPSTTLPASGTIPPFRALKWHTGNTGGTRQLIVAGANEGAQVVAFSGDEGDRDGYIACYMRNQCGIVLLEAGTDFALTDTTKIAAGGLASKSATGAVVADPIEVASGSGSVTRHALRGWQLT